MRLMAILTPRPVKIGSGKFVSPCERMHCENRSAAARWLMVGGCGLPPPGRCDRHACIADWNAGPLTSTPFTLVPFGPDWTRRLRGPPVVGSGKLGTPWERMQEANASAAVALLDALTLPVLELELELEPQAARVMLLQMSVMGRRDLMPEWYASAGYSAGTGAVTGA